MKKLRQDYTTPEQSKRLLELGVSKSSANYVYFEDWLKIGRDIIPENETYEEYTRGRVVIAPCWSVGRLIEISRICSTLPDEEWMFPFWKDIEDNIEWSIRVLESGVRVGNMDFSKLED